jgi:putative ABC transport system permease protein
MINTAASQLRHHPGRIGAVLLAVMISVGYLTATLSFMATETHAIGAQISARTSGADVVASSDKLNARQLGKRQVAARKTDGVSSVAMSYQIYAMIGRTAPLTLQNLPEQHQLRWAHLEAGHWPTDANQIALGRTSAEANKVGVGDTVSVDLGGTLRKLTVTGITDETKSLFSGQTQTGFVANSFITHPEQYGADLLVIGNGSVGQQQLADRLDHALGKHVTVQTQEAYSADQVKGLAQGADVLRNLLLIFGAIALLVGCILIVNTFLILLAQRRRQIGLLRAVGASAAQVRRSLLVEALFTGVIGAVLGVALGIGGTAVASAISGSLGDGLVVPPTVAIAAVVGILVTLLAAMGPARRATRVSPLEALRPVDDSATARRGSAVSGISAAVLAVAGIGLIIIGLKMAVATLLSCIAGSMLIAVAVLLGAKLYFPWLLRLIGLLVRGLGPVGRLATENTARNPGRAAATGAALMLATGLIVTLQVGAASVKASTNLTLDQHYPVDVTATLGKKLPSDVATRIEGIRGIEKAVTLKSVPATVVTEDHHKIAVPLESADDLSGVINKGAGDVPKDRILIDPFLAKNYDVRDGSQVKIRAGGTTRTMTIEANRIAADGVAVVAPGVLHAIAPNASVTTVWAKAAQDADPVKISAALSKIVDDHPDLQVSGSLTTKATYTKLLDTLLTIATVLLAVAVVIALIGVGNTLGLSVIERSRESALLRALGLQRRQLRLMLAIEAVLLALAGALVGIAAGAFFGWVGTAAIGSELDYQTTVFSMSGMQTAVVAAIAIVAGVLASVLPARRAARATPVSALAES